MWKATILDNFTPDWCLIVLIGYIINKIVFMSILTLSQIHSVRKKREIACNSVTNRARKDFKNGKWFLEQTDPDGSRCQICIYYRFP